MSRLFVKSLAALGLLVLSGCKTDGESMAVFLSKEMCSCHFVVGQSLEACRSALSLSLALGSVEVDEDQKSATATIKQDNSVSKFSLHSDRFGCAKVD